MKLKSTQNVRSYTDAQTQIDDSKILQEELPQGGQGEVQELHNGQPASRYTALVPCFHPIEAHKKLGGEIKFLPARLVSDIPLTLACGQCTGCRLERSRQWAVRMVHESKMHKKNCFLTLTYDDAHLPESRSLDVTHWQKFARRVRKKVGPFRFYHCGEYGEKNGRMHLHAAVFGQDFSADRKQQSITDQGHRLYSSAQLSTLWPNGLSVIGDLTFESCAYVARYVTKKITGERALDHYTTHVDIDTGEVHSLKPPYATMSRNPGIGATWLKKFHTDVYPADEVISNGHPARPPKFYDNQLEKNRPELFAAIKRQRKKQGEKHSSNNTPDRLRVRESVMEARTSALKRSLE
nr:MAG: replication initiation protein [Microvirus sp.]